MKGPHIYNHDVTPVLSSMLLLFQNGGHETVAEGMSLTKSGLVYNWWYVAIRQFYTDVINVLAILDLNL